MKVWELFGYTCCLRWSRKERQEKEIRGKDIASETRKGKDAKEREGKEKRMIPDLFSHVKDNS
jgi:hypothetical protein